MADRFDIERVEVVEVGFSGLTRGDMGGADVAISQLTPTDERDEVLDFSTPYLDTPPGVLVWPGTEARDLHTLQQLSWVVLSASTLRSVIEDDVRPEQDPIVVETRAEALDAIRTQRADAVLLDLPVALALAHAEPNSYDVIGQLPGSEGLAVALPTSPRTCRRWTRPSGPSGPMGPSTSCRSVGSGPSSVEAPTTCR